eukprot:TRINITY_DN3392_c0_g1_i1.p1 TRINITY_DN3392_c0_g1~~TRINITY_DN3392_c0_g1_i1.p1  ORF type:complete len:533 (+),score=119.67 TRINITY_DN3392_c0_g1_i1:236-1600(+)
MKGVVRSSSWPKEADRGYHSDSEVDGDSTMAVPRVQFTLMDYLKSEMAGSYMPESDVNYLIEKKEEVYNFFRVPFHLEKLLMFGLLLCLDSFLFLFTFLPIRVILASCTLVFRLITLKPHFSLTQVWDLSRGFIVIACFLMLTYVDASRLYHYIRAQSVLKLYVVFNVLEVGDRLCCSFGQDIFDALFLKTLNRNAVTSRELHLHPITIFFVALTYTGLHSLVLFLQVVTLNVAINSDNNALLTLIISNQFVELKGSVFKKFEKENLFQVSCSDIVERFQIATFLLIVTLQNYSDMNWEISEYWISHMITSVVTVWVSECLVDWIKHAFISKFNRIPVDVYPSYRTRLIRDIVSADKKSYFDTYTISRRIGFVPLPLACLVLRVLGMLGIPESIPRIPFFFGIWMVLCIVKVFIRLQLISKAMKYHVLAAFKKREQSNDENLPDRYAMYNGKIP